MIGSIARRRQFVLARYLLSTCLYNLTNRHYSIDTLGTGLETGQPIICNSQLWCSMSHSGNSISVAISQYGAIGIDIEHNRRRNIESIVSAYFHPKEIEEFNVLKRTYKNDWFYQQWTRKEATGKLKGQGISGGNLRQRSIPCEYTAHYLKHKNYSVSCVHKGPTPIKLFRVCLLEDEPWVQKLPIKWRSAVNSSSANRLI